MCVHAGAHTELVCTHRDTDPHMGCADAATCWGMCPPTGTGAHAAARVLTGTGTHACAHTEMPRPACMHTQAQKGPRHAQKYLACRAPGSRAQPPPAPPCERQAGCSSPQHLTPAAQALPGWLRGSRGCGDPNPGAKQAGSPWPATAPGPDGAAAAARSGSCSSVDARRDAAAWRTERGRGADCSSRGGGAVWAAGGAAGKGGHQAPPWVGQTQGPGHAVRNE